MGCRPNGPRLLALVFGEGGKEGSESFWFVAMKGFLVDVDEIVLNAALAGVDLGAPLLGAPHLQGNVHIFQSFCLADKELAWRLLNDEIGEVV